tara:strand:+ start:164 stop:589 length:426 start_codon:yes stop_codon:yes gene_type:complete
MNEDYNPCECNGAGFCKRYGSEVTENTYKLCKHKAVYRKGFEIAFADTAEESVRNEEAYLRSQEIRASRNLVDDVMKEVEKEGIDTSSEEAEEGLGTVLSKVFSKFGITEEKIEEWSGVGGCGCGKRKKFLNKILPFKKTL